MPARRNGERGSSLIEVLIAVAILGISAAALLGGISTLAITSSGHSDQARAETVLTSAAERLRENGVAHVQCATDASYLAAVQSVVPSEWTAAVSITEIRYWDGTDFRSEDDLVDGSGNDIDCVDLDADLLTLQLVTIQVESPDGRTVETVSVVKAP